MTDRKPLRLTEKTLADVRCGYLYDNGKLVLVHDSAHPKAGRVEWVTIHDTTIDCAFKGRLVLHRTGVIRLTLTASRISAQEMSTANGSENTRRRNLAIGHIGLELGKRCYTDCVYIPLIDGLSGDWTYQPENVWVEQEIPTRWAGYPVSASL